MTEVNKVVTLLAEKGKKWEETQECVASHKGCIVFLPKVVRPGDIVRTLLSPILEEVVEATPRGLPVTSNVSVVVTHTSQPKLDKRGKQMFRASLAAPELSDGVRESLALEAIILRGCKVYDQATALALLTAKYGTMLDSWKEYAHYFFDESGWVFVSHLSPASLYIFEQFDMMQGSALTEPLLWALDKGYYALREQGKELDWRSNIPQLTDEAVAELVKKVEAGEPILSTALVQVMQGKVEIPGLVDQLWRRASWLALAIPNFEGGEELPAVVSHEYGRDPNGEILKGYGVLVLLSSGSASWQWHKDFVSATVAHEQSTAELEKLREIWASKTQIKPQLEAITTRLIAAGVSSISFESTKFRWGWESFEYSAESLAIITKRIEEREAEAAMRKAAEEKLMAKEVEEQHLRERGYPTDFTCHHERGHGKTHRQCWVIQADGRERESDHNLYERHKHVATVWNVIKPGEIALMWEKGSAASNHYFTVVHMPDTLTREQVETICAILEGIEEAWKGACGLASGILSPNVGDGWLHPETGRSLTLKFKTRRQQIESGRLPEFQSDLDAPIEPIRVAKSVAEGGELASQEALAALAARFKK